MRFRSSVNDQRISTLLIIVVSLSFLAACSAQSSSSQSGWMRNETIPLSPGESVEITLDRAEISLQGTSGSALRIEASSNVGSADKLIVKHQAGKVVIMERSSLHSAAGDILLQFKIPYGQSVAVDLRGGGIDLQNLTGSVNVKSISADIQAEQIEGTLWITNPRGEVHVQDSTGEIHVLGQAGGVRLINLHGATFVSTIMGQIEFAGEPRDGDRIKIESDHGGVLLRLSPQTDADLELTSAGGQIICSLPGLNEVGRDCSASLNDGSASVEVRTVSGTIRIQSLLLEP
jgi:DUF4097 and DUF4098 domain-containing protein YvlB